MKTSNHGISSFKIIIILSIFVLVGLTTVTIEGRPCKTDDNCLGIYIHCCSGYCRRSCNLTCSRDDQCGSPPSIEEHCCKGTCTSTSVDCEKRMPNKENVLSSPVIAVIAIFGVVLVAVLCCVFRAHLCKYRALWFGNRGSQQGDSGSKMRGGAGFVELGRVGTDESLNNTERLSLQSNNTWVGQDFRIVYPKSSSERYNHM